MKHFIRPKIGFGILLTLLLAFSVQGIADALTFGTSRTGDLETVVVNNEFTISFSVSLGSNTTRITDADGNLIKDSTTTGGAANARIDSSGYLVVEIEGREYRTIKTDPTGKLVIDPRPTYDDEDPDTAGTPVSPYYVDSGGNVVDANGEAVYVQTGTGIRADNDRWRYTRAKADPNDKVPDLNRYHYNEESISISAPVDLKRVGNYAVNVPGGTEHTMDEQRNSVNEDKLTSSIRLTYFVDTAGKYTITIKDTTPASDRPGDRSPDLRFTIFAVPALDNTTDLSLTGDGEDGYETGNDHADPRVDTLFGVGATNVPLVYSVEGSGRLYVKETYSDSPVSQSRPTQTLSTSSEAEVFLEMNGSSNKVTAYVRDRNAAETRQTITFIFNYAQIEIIRGNDQTGVPDSRLIDPLGIRVTDARGRALSELAVRFTPVGGATLKPVLGTDVYLDTNNEWADDFADIDRTKAATATVPAAINENAAAWVPTDRSGEAQVYLELGKTGSKTVTVSAGGSMKTFDVTSAETTDIPSLEIFSGNNQRSESNGKVQDPLVVRVLTSTDQPFPTQLVTFTTTKGYLTTLPPYQDSNNTINGPATQVTAQTDLNGRAGVSYDLVEHSGAADVIAEISSSTIPTYQRRVTFNINGTDSRPEPSPSPSPQPTLFSVTSSISGTPGSTQSLSVTAPAGTTVNIGVLNDTFRTAGGSASPTTFFGSNTATLTLPSTAGTYSLTVFAGNDLRSVSVTVTSAEEIAQTGSVTVRILPGRGDPGAQSTVTVTATEADGDPAANVEVTLSVTAGGGTFIQSGTATVAVTTGTDGIATATLTRGSTPGSNYYVTVSPSSGYTYRGPSSGERLIISGAQPGTGTPGTTTTTGSAATLDDYDGGGQLGSLNTPLAEPLVVEVVDANDNPVEGVRVRFRTTIGTGVFSPRTPRTDEEGLAETRFTPTSPGRIRIVATVAGVTGTAAFTVQGGDPADALVKVSGDTQSGTPGNALVNPFIVEVRDEDGEPLAGHTVTFEVTAGGGSLSETSDVSGANGQVQTTLTLGSERGVNSVRASVPGADPVTFSTSIDPTILVSAANRPVMYWIDDGALYRLAGTKAAQIAEGVNGLAVGSDKIYWTSTTGASAGTINAANLDGSGAQVLTTIMAVPMGIAVDTVNSYLYWTNSRGRIQRATLTGTGIQNVLQNRSEPGHIVLSSDTLYWTEGGNSIRRVSKSGPKTVKDVAVGLSTLGGLAVGGGKIYWTEQTGASAGTINGADLDGTQFATLATIKSVPIGIAVDTTGSHLYWTNARGRVQRATLNGTGIRNVVEGLISASQLVLGGANTETETVVKQATQPTPKAAAAKYDVNGDGTVDNTDASLVAGAMNTSNAQYDVNGDGTVNFLDLLLVFDNRDAGVAGAPTVIGMKLSAVQIDIIEEQIKLLIATNDRSPAAMRTLIYLQHLIATARPEQTRLLANYPNPFNPETWIPYELARDTDVRITIYNTQGVVIRTLALGHQSAGYYTGRDRAAYWDGRNALGEQVASGVYFYQFETDTMSSMRKMVILK